MMLSEIVAHKVQVLLTFLETSSAGKLCLEITHNALVQVFLSVAFDTSKQSADSISAVKTSAKNKQK